MRRETGAKRRGSVLLETALAMPVLLTLIFGTVQFALVWTARQQTAYAAFCAARAILVVPPAEQSATAQSAAEAALAWMNLADNGSGNEVSVPGWGAVVGSGTSADSTDWGSKRVQATIVSDGSDDAKEAAAVTVRFRYPLLVPGMSVAAKIGAVAAGAASAPEIDGWPYVELCETCALPMPYSTEDFPTNAFKGVSIRGGS